MKDNLAWILAVVLILAGIALFALSGDSGARDEVQSATNSLKSAINKGLHSEAVISDVKQIRDQRAAALEQREAEVKRSDADAIDKRYAAIFQKRAPGTSITSSFAGQQWISLRESFAKDVMALRRDTQRPAWFNIEGQRWVESNPEGTAGTFKGQLPTQTFARPPYANADGVTPFLSLSEQVDDFQEQPEDPNSPHLGKFAVVCLEDCLAGLEAAVAGSLNGQTFYLEEIDFDEFEYFQGGPGSTDAFSKYAVSMSMQIDPTLIDDLKASLKAQFAKPGAPMYRIVKTQIMQGDQPRGLRIPLTKEQITMIVEKLDDENIKDMPSTAKEYDEWRVNTFPEIQRYASENRIGVVQAPARLVLRIEAWLPSAKNRAGVKTYHEALDLSTTKKEEE